MTTAPPLPEAPGTKDLATACVLCSHACGLRVDVAGGHIVAVRPDKSSPITAGYVCNKAYSIDRYVNHLKRVRHPLRRRADGGFERVSWDHALADIAARLSAIRERHSPRAIGLIGSGGQANHMAAFFAASFMSVLGTRRFFCPLAQEKAQHWLVQQWMLDASPGRGLHPDLERTRFLLVMGTNPLISNRGHNPTETLKALARDPERSMVVVDPRQTETTRLADRHVRLRPGSDVYFLLGLIRTILDRGLVDPGPGGRGAQGYDALGAAMAAVDVAVMAERCGIEADEITAVAEGFAGAEAAALLWDLGIEQTRFSTLNSYLVHLLLALTGNLGRRGGNVFTRGLAAPVTDPKRHRQPERALASGIQAISTLGRLGMLSPTLVPEEILLDHPERLRALIVESSNPLLSFSDTALWRQARERLELLVVIDPALSETAELADYVLPAPTAYEKWEVCTLPRGFPAVHAQLRPPVLADAGEALPEPEIYSRLAEALELVPAPPQRLARLAAGASTPEGARAYFEALNAEAAAAGFRGPLFWAYRTLGPRLAAPALVAVWFQCLMNALQRPDQLLPALGSGWQGRDPFAMGLELFRRLGAAPQGVEVARLSEATNLEEQIGFADGRLRLAPKAMLGEVARAIATPPPHDEAYPFILANALRTAWTANTMHRDPAWRKGKGPHCALHLAPDDAQALGLAEGDKVRVITRRNAVVLPATLDARLRTGHVWFPNGFGMTYPSAERRNVAPEPDGVNMNEITDAADRDPISGCPHHKYAPCRLEKVAAAADEAGDGARLGA